MGPNPKLLTRGLAAPVEAQLRAGEGARFGATFAEPRKNKATRFRARGE